MARIYAHTDNGAVQQPHFAERPLKELLDLLALTRSETWSASGPAAVEPRAAREFVQIEVERNEGEGSGWRDGWHLVRMTESTAKERLALVHQ
jgi:hypothetical protein